jgi:hypothetical protein
MKLGDSRSLEGVLIPAQDHRIGIDHDLRAQQVCVRLVDRDQEGRSIDEQDLRGDRRGISVWDKVGDRRPTPMWREFWICVVCGPQGYTGSGLGNGLDEPGAEHVSDGGGGSNLEVGAGGSIPGYGGGSGGVQGSPVVGLGNAALGTLTYQGGPQQPGTPKQSSLSNGYSV